MTTQTLAKRFFVEKVIAQARFEGLSLSDAEREMLSPSAIGGRNGGRSSLARRAPLKVALVLLKLAATIVFLAACGARPPRPAVSEIAPAVPRQIHAEIRDSSVDALPDYRVPVSPDIISAVVDVGADEIVFRLRHRPGSFESSTTSFTIDLDTDRNASTGSEGIEYYVFVFPSGEKGADVARTTSTGYAVIGTVPVSVVTDGCDVAIPRSLLRDDQGRFDFRVKVYAQPALPLVLDVLPDTGLVRIE